MAVASPSGPTPVIDPPPVPAPPPPPPPPAAPVPAGENFDQGAVAQAISAPQAALASSIAAYHGAASARLDQAQSNLGADFQGVYAQEVANQRGTSPQVSQVTQQQAALASAMHSYYGSILSNFDDQAQAYADNVGSAAKQAADEETQSIPVSYEDTQRQLNYLRAQAQQAEEDRRLSSYQTQLGISGAQSNISALNSQVAGQYAGDDVHAAFDEAVKAKGLTPAEAAAFAKLVQGESGFRNIPQEVNDVNMQNGTPAFGPAQMIQSTFNKYADPGHTDWHNPLDNLLASINYQRARYGRILDHSGY